MLSRIGVLVFAIGWSATTIEAASLDVGSDTRIESLCAAANDDLLGAIKSTLVFIGGTLPNIPPEEETYLAAEAQATNALAPGAEQSPEATELRHRRQNKLAQRRLYYVWMVRRDLPEALLGLDFIVSDPAARMKAWFADKAPQFYFGIEWFSEPEAEKLQLAIDEKRVLDKISRNLFELLIREEAHRADPILTVEQHSRLYGTNLLLSDDILRYMSCKLAKFAASRTTVK